MVRHLYIIGEPPQFCLIYPYSSTLLHWYSSNCKTTHTLSWQASCAVIYFIGNLKKNLVFSGGLTIHLICFSRERIISMKFMRKYIHVARDMKPQLTREAADFIADEYSKLRNQENMQADNIARVRGSLILPLNRLLIKLRCFLGCSGENPRSYHCINFWRACNKIKPGWYIFPGRHCPENVTNTHVSAYFHQTFGAVLNYMHIYISLLMHCRYWSLALIYRYKHGKC